MSLYQGVVVSNYSGEDQKLEYGPVFKFGNDTSVIKNEILAEAVRECKNLNIKCLTVLIKSFG